MSDALAMVLRRLDRIEAKLTDLEARERAQEIAWPTGLRPKFWPDVAVRNEVIRLHREMTLEAAHSALVVKFGPERAPSRSAIQRAWKNIDEQKRDHRRGARS